MITPRAGIVVWLRDYKKSKALESYGVVHYVSRKMRYAVLYVNLNQVDEVMANVAKLPFVKTAERSFRHELRTDYSSSSGEKNKFLV
jgi:uncharacterized protein YlbG (UPF0298 family)